MNVTITRELYRQIKSMDRASMNKYLADLYNTAYSEGHKAGVHAMSQELAGRVERGIRATPGIGEKRYKDLLDHINTEITREGEPEDEDDKTGDEHSDR